MVITLFLILKTGTQNWTPYKIEQIYAINANYNRLSTITQKVGEMKITLRQGFKPP